MRGRTNVISSGGEAVANGKLEEFVVAEGQTIKKGDFVSTKNNATKEVEAIISNCSFYSYNGHTGLIYCNVFDVGEFNGKKFIAVMPSGSLGYILYIYNSSENKMELQDMIQLEDFGDYSVVQLKSGNLCIMGNYLFCTYYKLTSQSGNAATGYSSYYSPFYCLYEIQENNSRVSIKLSKNEVFKSDEFEKFEAYSDNLKYFVQKINENYITLYVQREGTNRDWEGIHLYKLEGGELVHKYFYKTDVEIVGKDVISVCCYNGEDIILMFENKTFVYHFDAANETIAKKNTFAIGGLARCNVLYNGNVYFLTNNEIMRIKVDGSDHPSTFPVENFDTRGAFVYGDVLYKLCLEKTRTSNNIYKYDMYCITYDIAPVMEKMESFSLFQSAKCMSRNILIVQSETNIFFLYVQGNESYDNSSDIPTRSDGRLISVEGDLIGNEIILSPDNLVYKYNGSNKAIGFAKTGGTSGQTVKVYVPWEDN